MMNAQVPPEIMAQAQELGREEEEMNTEMLETASPKGSFSAEEMSGMVIELNKVLALFEDSYPEIAENLNEFPAELTNKLVMIQDAAQQAGLEWELELETIVDDKGVMLLAGKLRQLSEDKTFQKFLESSSIEGEEAPIEEPTTTTEQAPADMDALFAARS